ncbi:MAG TPA: family 20 glycosylhydrolase [Gemmatimonadales bacterium]|nr:family 20 glycosylhydrolase [Gemmatimonadales bacterium]
MLPLILALAVSAPAPDTSSHPALLPWPKTVTWNAGALRLDSTFAVTVAGRTDPRLERALSRALVRLSRRTGITLGTAIGHGSAGTFVVHATSPGPKVPDLAQDESYTLTVTPSAVTLDAPTTVGVIRGVETLLQLVSADSTGYFLPAVAIADAPRFRWRGLLLDVGRHFEPVEVVERTLDGMAAAKLNVLHWHLSEDQGFRVESRRFPRLQEFGSDGLYYTQDQVRAVVAYAADRGIRVVPEFDMPGHSTSWFVGYPQYASGKGPYAIQRTWGVFDPAFDPTRESVYRFLDGFIGEMSGLFPDAFWHIGGDEVPGTEWKANPRIQAWMKAHHIKDNAALQAHFNRRLIAILARHHRQVVGWDEILNPALPKTAVIQSWRGTSYLGDAAKQGYRGILSAPYYLDHIDPASQHYLADPLPASAGLTDAESARVLGGEACMWSEYVGPGTVESRIWPRMLAVAERFWSPASVTDVADMYRRMGVVSVQLSDLGIEHLDHARLFVARMMNGAPGGKALERLLEVTEPGNFGQRADAMSWTQQTPLVRLVDAAVPDPASRRVYGDLATRAIAGDTAARSALDRKFAELRELPAGVRAAARNAPLAAEGIPAADMVAAVGAVGLAADSFLARGATMPVATRDSALSTLRDAGKPYGMLRLTIVDAVQALVEAAGGKP